MLPGDLVEGLMSASDLPTGSVDVGTASRREDPGMRRNTIHRSAVIGPGVRLRIRNTIRPYAVVTGQVELGDDTCLWFGAAPDACAQWVGASNDWSFDNQNTSGSTIIGTP